MIKEFEKGKSRQTLDGVDVFFVVTSASSHSYSLSMLFGSGHKGLLSPNKVYILKELVIKLI